MPPSFITGQVHGLIWHGLEAIGKFLTLSSDYEEDYYDYLVSISSLSLFIAKLDNYVWVYDEHLVGEQNIRQSNMSNVIPVIKTWKQKIRSRKLTLWAIEWCIPRMNMVMNERRPEQAC